MSASGIEFASEAPANDRTVAGEAAGRTWLLWAVGVLLLVVYGPTVVWLWGRWTMSVWHNAHGMFIPLVVAWLVWQELGGARGLPRAGGPLKRFSSW